MNSLLIVLGNQLFDKKFHPDDVTNIFMCEDLMLCTNVKHHKKKLAFFLSTMREYKDEMTKSGYNVSYYDFNNLFEKSISFKLSECIKSIRPEKIYLYEIEDKDVESVILDFLESQSINYEILDSPMFMHSRSYFENYQQGKRTLLLENFYRKSRKEFNILMLLVPDILTM